ncbi:cell division protein CrgA [Bifidobacterium simiarum]|uniref:Cell division protein CrgA n=1 Tax=Bifidobacterium simiarum TaxID=2045441 RepID=A0A2M9HCB3_9BIFI|nr:cell division protein CrgA [Bifidobacterium simiarum]MBT1166919.1 cell division protein CrgA [Bifidobacterium simiarum]PJM74449.1 septation inhibitor protein [Bifidobacterium simiarum]
MAEQDELKLDETDKTGAGKTANDTAAKADQAGADDDFGVSMDKVEAVLNRASADDASMTPQMKKMFARQQENTKRVEESIKGTKSNPGWFVPLFCALLILGLVWVVVFYLTSKWPIPAIGQWNLLVGFGIMLVGFLMTMWWR